MGKRPKQRHYCPNCKCIRGLLPYTGVKLDKEEREHVFECGTCGHIVDIWDPRNKPQRLPDPPYQIAKSGNRVVIIANLRAADLIASSLEIINPVSRRNEDLAREMSLAIMNA